MQIGFKCPDGGLILHEDCLKKCRMGKRCACITTLYGMAEARKWTGKPSVTQLLKGTREAYLTIMHDFYVDPQKLMYSIHGRMVHFWNEHYGKLMGFPVEITHPDNKITGILDLLIPTGKENEFDLVDYKTWGSYTAAKALGYFTVDVATGGYYKSGAKKGLLRTKKEVQQSDDEIDWSGADLQLNQYRLYCEEKGMTIRDLKVEVKVRDGGIMAASRRGVKNNIYYLDVPRLPDDEVKDHFDSQYGKLMAAVKSATIPEVCTEEERWDDNKCKKYCDVAEFCDHGKACRDDCPFED